MPKPLFDPQAITEDLVESNNHVDWNKLGVEIHRRMALGLDADREMLGDDADHLHTAGIDDIGNK